MSNQEIFIAKTMFEDDTEGAIQGIIGEDILSNFNIGLDFPHHQLQLYARNNFIHGFPWSGNYAALPYPTDEPAPQITFYVDNKPVVGLIDSGASVLAINQEPLSKAHVSPEKTGATRTDIGIGALTGTTTDEQFALLTVGGEAFRGPWIAVSHKEDFGDADALIGDNYLHNHQVYINNDTNTVWLGTASP